MKLLGLLLLAAPIAQAATYSYSVYNPSNARITNANQSNFTSNGGIIVDSGVFPGLIAATNPAP